MHASLAALRGASFGLGERVLRRGRGVIDAARQSGE